MENGSEYMEFIVNQLEINPLLTLKPKIEDFGAMNDVQVGPEPPRWYSIYGVRIGLASLGEKLGEIGIN